jgi:3-oxoacyl-[acyl-carrier-protein] synthase-3
MARGIPAGPAPVQGERLTTHIAQNEPPPARRRERAEPRIGYLGFGAHLPSTELTNDQLAGFIDTSDEWIVRRTGIRSRRILGRDETILGMAVAAARAALADAGVAPAEIGDIRVAVNTWMRFPSLATQLQKVLGCPRASAADVSAGCAGFIYALEEAYNKIFVERLRHGRGLRSLVVGVDGLSQITDWTDRGTCVLLGDGAGAVVLGETAGAAGEILAIHTHADGRFGDLIYSDFVLESQLRRAAAPRFTHRKRGPRAYLHMNGSRTFHVAVKTMAEDIQTVIEKHNRHARRPVSVGDIDFVFPHQANLRIIEAVAKQLDFPLEKVYTEGVARYGNTSTASIPIGYADLRDRPLGAGGFEVDVAFGAGLASGAVLRRAGRGQAEPPP